MKKLFLLLLPAILFSCSSDDSDAEIVYPVIPDNSAVLTYIKGSMNGTAFDFYYANTLTPQYLYGYSNGYSGDGFTKWFYYGGEFSPTGDFDTRMLIAFNNMFGGNETDESTAFYDSFATVPTNFINSEENDAHLKGVDMEYQIGDEYYSTIYGSQAGSTFTVTNATQGIEPGGTLKIKTVTGTISCKLYNMADPSDVINVTNGQYKLTLREFN